MAPSHQWGKVVYVSRTDVSKRLRFLTKAHPHRKPDTQRKLSRIERQLYGESNA